MDFFDLENVVNVYSYMMVFFDLENVVKVLHAGSFLLNYSWKVKETYEHTKKGR